MLLQVVQLTVDDSYDFNEEVEESIAFINVNYIESVVECDEYKNRCYVYMTSGDFMYIDESCEQFMSRYNSALYGAVLTKFYNSTNRQS